MRKIKNPAAEIPLPGFDVYYDDFLASRKEELVLLLGALANGEFKVLQQMAHTWKGYANPYGFQELGESAIELEIAAEANDSTMCFEILHRIKAYLGD